MKSSQRIAGWVVAGNLVVAIVLILATLTNLRTGRAVELDRAREATENLAHGLSMELAAELRLVDNALSTIALHYAQPGAARERARALELSIREQGPLLPFVRAIRATDRDGEVTQGTPAEDLQLSIADRRHFEAARTSGELVISDPLRSHVLDEWCVLVAKRLLSSDGRFEGIVYAVLSAPHFQQLFQRFSLGQDGAVSLRTDSLHLVARYSNAASGSGQGIGTAQVSEQLKAALASDRDKGWYITPTALDKIERVTAYRRVAGYPLTVLAGVSTDHYLASHRSMALRQWAFTIAVLSLVATGSGYLFLQHRRQHAARLSASRLAKEQSLLLDNELVGMLRVEQRRVLWANRAACQMLGYQATQLIGATTRSLYPDEAAFAAIGGQAAAALRTCGSFRTQLKMLTAGGRLLWIDLSGAALTETESIWMLVDIDKLKCSEEQAQHQALHDPLTGLANRRLLELQLRQALLNAQRSGQDLAIAYLDLDRFKPINDRHGHDAGDRVLKTVAERLTMTVRANDTVARLGGDEFVLLLTGLDQASGTPAVLQRCMEVVRSPIALEDGTLVHVGCSMGVARRSIQGDAADDLLAAADAAMYAAKREGGGRGADTAPAAASATA